MKKLNLNLEGIKVMLSNDEMKKISGGDSGCDTNAPSCPYKCMEKISGTWTCSTCCVA